MNPATRILNTVDTLLKTKIGENEKALKAWSTILAQTKEGENQLTETEVSRRLVNLINQLDQLTLLLEEEDTPSQLYDKVFLKIQKGLSPANLSQRWLEVKNNFSPEAVVTLQWSEWTVGSLEGAIGVEDRQAIQTQINEFQEMLDSTSLSGPIAKILQSQISALTEALQDYEIYGIEPLEKALKIITSDLVSNSEEIIEAKQESPQETNRILGKLNTIMSTTLDVVDRAGKTIGGLEKLWNIGQKAIEYGNSTPNPPVL